MDGYEPLEMPAGKLLDADGEFESPAVMPTHSQTEIDDWAETCLKQTTGLLLQAHNGTSNLLAHEYAGGGNDLLRDGVCCGNVGQGDVSAGGARIAGKDNCVVCDVQTTKVCQEMSDQLA